MKFSHERKKNQFYPILLETNYFAPPTNISDFLPFKPHFHDILNIYLIFEIIQFHHILNLFFFFSCVKNVGAGICSYYQKGICTFSKEQNHEVDLTFVIQIYLSYLRHTLLYIYNTYISMH